MIKPGEIQQTATQNGVRDQQIEKDYVLSWILQGIAWHEDLSQVIVFKGGTVLKKIYFRDYRFSEDLDFTLLNDRPTNARIFEWFEQVFGYIQEGANIPLAIVDKNEQQDGGINFYISYIGPLGSAGAKIFGSFARGCFIGGASFIQSAFKLCYRRARGDRTSFFC